jgi:hypothetical protein
MTVFSADMHRKMAASYLKLAETHSDMVVRKKLIDAAAWRETQAARLEGVADVATVPDSAPVADVEVVSPVRTQKSRRSKG